MKARDFKTIARILKQAYAELEKEAINEGVDILSAEFDQIKANLRLRILEKHGFTLDQYREAKKKVVGFSESTVIDTMDEVKGFEGKLNQSLSELPHIHSEEEIREIAEEEARKHVKPPQITNEIVKEVTRIEPRIVKETTIEKVVEEKSYNEGPILDEIEGLKEAVKTIKDTDIESMKEEIRSDFSKYFKKNIDILGMPDFRKLAMGLQAQIDDFSGGGHVIEDEGTPLTQRDNLNFTGAGVSVTDSGGKTVVTINGGGGGVNVETPTGTVDGSNADFTVSNEPTWVVSDGVTYFDGAGYSYAAGSLTMDIPPSQYIRSIY